ncbi:MAG: glycosyltransferase, partial [Ignavibacteria bacterium]|nr:glycosyltransferase [Ignavibacteria bacterium]
LNEEKLLPRILDQFPEDLLSRHRIELIISDGGSTDRTLEIARAHPGVTVVENAEGVKQTISIGRNEGARHAQGATLVFLNADTLVPDQERFFSMIAAEIARPEICAVTCNVRVYPEDESFADVLFHGFYNWFFFMMNRVGMAMGRGECHVMSREAFDAVGGYAGAIAAGEDYDMFRRLSRVGAIRFLRQLCVHESPRRYRKYGYMYVTTSWFLNFLSVFFLGRSILDQWKPVR